MFLYLYQKVTYKTNYNENKITHILAILVFSANFLFAQETEPFVCGTIMEETVKFHQVVDVSSNNHTLDVNSNTKTLDLRNYSDGLYKLILVVDGQSFNQKLTIKNFKQ